MPVPTVLRLWRGYPSAYSLGLASSTPNDPSPVAIDLLNEGFTILNANGQTGWIPKIASSKAGLWADSATQDGRRALDIPVENVNESMELVCTGRPAAYAALSRLNLFGQAARDFWAEIGQDPVYIEWRAPNAPGSQFALIYDLNTALVDGEMLTDLGLSDTAKISLTFEREPAWRGIEPGISAKVWAMREARDLQPTTTNPAPAGCFGYDDLDLGTGSGNYAPLITATVRQGDELGTSNVNYIDIPAEYIPGDAPALCTITWNPSGIVTETWTKFWISKQIRRDLFPTGNTAGTLSTSRARMILSAGDATDGVVTNVTITTPITADGWFSNSSIVNRYVKSLAFAAGVAGSTFALRWTMRYSQFGGSYAVFMRHSVTVGTASTISVQASAILPDSTVITLGQVALNTTVSGPRGGLIFLGRLDIPYRRYVNIDGTGLNSSQNVQFQIVVIKPGATTPTLLIWDLQLMPLDYGVVEIGNLGASTVGLIHYDTTGYLGIEPSAYGESNAPRKVTGDALTLTPGVDNRLYFTNNSTGGVWDMDGTAAAAVDIVPRWYGARDE